MTLQREILAIELGDICVKPSEGEVKVIRELLNTVQTEEPIDMLNKLLEKRNSMREPR